MSTKNKISNYKTSAKNGKLLFEITKGQFAGVQYLYEKADLRGKITYKIKAKKNLVNEDNKILFESVIHYILKDKLSKI